MPSAADVGAVANALVTAKGQIVGASASGTPVAIPAAGANGRLLVSDTAETSGWVADDTLTVDRANDRLGVGISPTANLDVAGKGRFLQVDAPTTGAIILRQPTGDTTAAYIQWVNNANSAQRAFVGADENGIYIAGPNTNVSFTVDINGRVVITPTVVLEAPLVQNAQTDSYTLVRGDAGKLIEMGKATAQTLTVPLNSSVAFPTGTKIDIIQTGAGETTIAATGGVTINSEGSKLKLNAQWAGATLIKRATNTWILIGSLKA
jgi:hypothetical protein